MPKLMVIRIIMSLGAVLLSKVSYPAGTLYYWVRPQHHSLVRTEREVFNARGPGDL